MGNVIDLEAYRQKKESYTLSNSDIRFFFVISDLVSVSPHLKGGTHNNFSLGGNDHVDNH